MSILKIENLDLETFDHTKILEKIKFSVDEGDIVLITGVNGSGKSTFIKSVFDFYLTDEMPYARLEKTEDGILISEDTIEKISIYIDQSDAPGKEFKKVETVLLDSLPDSIKDKNKLLESWITEMMPLTYEDENGGYNRITGKKEKPLLNKRYVNLSGGQKKWVCILRGLFKGVIGGYKIAFIDEPLNNLDAEHIKRFSDLLLRIRKLHPEFSFVIVSHCRAFPKITKLYEIENHKLIEKKYDSNNCHYCFGETDEDGFYNKDMNPEKKLINLL